MNSHALIIWFFFRCAACASFLFSYFHFIFFICLWGGINEVGLKESPIIRNWAELLNFSSFAECVRRGTQWGTPQQVPQSKFHADCRWDRPPKLCRLCEARPSDPGKRLFNIWCVSCSARAGSLMPILLWSKKNVLPDIQTTSEKLLHHVVPVGTHLPRRGWYLFVRSHILCGANPSTQGFAGEQH